MLPQTSMHYRVWRWGIVFWGLAPVRKSSPQREDGDGGLFLGLMVLWDNGDDTDKTHIFSKAFDVLMVLHWDLALWIMSCFFVPRYKWLTLPRRLLLAIIEIAYKRLCSSSHLGLNNEDGALAPPPPPFMCGESFKDIMYIFSFKWKHDCHCK